MRILSIGILFLAIAACVSAQERTVTILADKEPALELAVPPDAKVTPVKDKTEIHTTNMFLYVWPVPGAKTIDEAQARLAGVIKGDVLKFAASATNEITVAGSRARHLIGNGVEANDGDDATADVVIFAAGSRIFVACVHGEGNDAPNEREPMLKMLQTARSPKDNPRASDARKITLRGDVAERSIPGRSNPCRASPRQPSARRRIVSAAFVRLWPSSGSRSADRNGSGW